MGVTREKAELAQRVNHHATRRTGLDGFYDASNKRASFDLIRRKNSVNPMVAKDLRPWRQIQKIYARKINTYTGRLVANVRCWLG